MPRPAPFASLLVLLRVVVKALCILAVANLIFLTIGVDPLQKLIDFNLWEVVGQGRARLIYPSDLTNGELPVEALLSAHAIAYTPKTPDEYRVVLLGDSGIAGWGLPDEQTLSAQLNARHLMITDKHVVFYNLAYPAASAARDTLILDAAKQYHIDLVIWFVTLDNLRATVNTEQAFLELNRDRLVNVARLGGLESWVDANVPLESGWPEWSAIRQPALFSIWLKSLEYPFVPPALGASDVRMIKRAIPATVADAAGQPSVTPLPNESWGFLQIGHIIAGNAELLLVNEAFFIGSGPNSDVNYNPHFQRKAYDDYHAALTDYAKRNNFWYLDLWNVVPAEHFTDSELHMDQQGWSIVADHLVGELQKVKGIHK